MAREQLKTLTEPMYYVLLSLIKENHGYGIMQMISERTEGRVLVGAGTLYTLLGRFEKEKIIEQTAEENRRKTYILTEKGQVILKEEYDRLNKLVSDGDKFMNFDGERPEPPDDTSSGITIPVEELCIEEKKTELKAEKEEQDIKKWSDGHLRKGKIGKGILVPSC